MGNSANKQLVEFETVQRWLATPLGNSLLQQEARVVEEAFDGIFGEQCLQLGDWGDPMVFLRLARTQRCALISEFLRVDGVSAIGQLHRLPVQADSIDAVILPHTLDYSDRPHAILREVHRVLRPNGHLIVLGFRPGGLWGLQTPRARRRAAAGRTAPAVRTAPQGLAEAARHADPRHDRVFLPLAAAGPQGQGVGAMGAARPALVAGALRVLYALGAETHQHADTGAPRVARKAESRCRAGRTFHASVANPL